MLFAIFVLIFALSACSPKATPETPTTMPLKDILLTPMPESMKGYNLYYWQEGEDWYFTLRTSTNAPPTLEEIQSFDSTITEDFAKVTVKGVESITMIIYRLPMGGQMFILDPEGKYVLPESAVQALFDACTARQIGVAMDR